MGRRRKSPLGTLDIWKACALGRHGYAHRYIASRQFGLVPEKLEKWQIGVISSVLNRNEIRVTDYRMGRTHTARAHADKVCTLVKNAAAKKQAFEGLRVWEPPQPKPRKQKAKAKPKGKGKESKLKATG